jgi:hypothetical protein
VPAYGTALELEDPLVFCAQSVKAHRYLTDLGSCKALTAFKRWAGW